MPDISQEDLDKLNAQASEAEKLRGQASSIQSELAQAKADAEKTKSAGGDVSKLQAQLDEQKKSMDVKELSMDKDRVIASHENLKGFEGVANLVRGNTVEELQTSAKTLSESLAKREEIYKQKLGTSNQQAWDKIPGSTGSSVGITRDRQDEYASVRADKNLNTRAKIAKMMNMKLMDNTKSVVSFMQRSLGISTTQ